jgi:hypothetical protein
MYRLDPLSNITGEPMTLGNLLLIVLILMLVGALPVANDPQRRAGLATRIGANLHSLTQSDALLQALDRALREMLAEPTSA